jgi:ABC-2 type transport system ATP-binding protein
MQAISVRGVTKRFGPVTALVDVAFEVGSGEIVALLGPNGAGKSTLLRILGTAILSDEGEAVVAGHDVVAEPDATRRSIGFLLADERSWYWRLTGRHNLEFFGALYGLRRPAAAERAAELLEEFGLADAADRRFDGYSSGMRLRLSLARALLSEPPVLLLDEPTRSIDAVGTRQFRELVKDVAARRGVAVLLATHDLHEAAQTATRSIVLSRGRVATITDGWTDTADLERRVVEASA